MPGGGRTRNRDGRGGTGGRAFNFTRVSLAGGTQRWHAAGGRRSAGWRGTAGSGAADPPG